MSLSKLASTAAQAIQQASSKSAKKVAQNLTSGTKQVSKVTKETFDALAAQGKAMVKKFDATTNNMAQKIEQGMNAPKAKKSVPLPFKNPLPPVVKEIGGFSDKKLVKDGDMTRLVKSAEASAGDIEFQKALEPFLANKSAKESAKVIEQGGEVVKKASLKPEVIQLKADLKAKHGDKLSEFHAQKVQAQRKADLMAKYGYRLGK